ncbi:glycosyltransferase family 2 protein [Brumicola nitratireducens]|uniref:glycosyltransferase family 2 protein n=1 Tax=Brumicola nitratireducens TaxID=300231 RepID=UPI00059D3709|nr:glycosyltransferase family 2 protein [Glaciecola nitratireducens]
MTPLAQTPFLSLVVPTRNRPQLFRRAILSILNQTFTNIEIIAVVDGATNDDLLEYQKLEKKFRTALTFIFLPHRENGHGPSFARNTGINVSKGLYIGFLDDDDEWTCNEHLARFYKSYEKSNAKLDIYFSNQRALKTNGDEVNGPVWIEDVIKKQIA